MKKAVTIFFLLVSIFSFAQKQGNIWCFADSSGIDFNSGGAELFPNCNISSNGSLEPQASISDKNGNLLIYTDGMTVWNKNFHIMQNGSGLNGNFSSTQGVVIIPKPQDSTQYYIFVVKPTGLFYNLVDINMDNGNGSIVNGYKNVLLLDTLLSEKQIAVKHANGRDWWLIVHGYNNNIYYMFLITTNGIQLTNVQKIGSLCYSHGESEVSYNGDKFASVGSSNAMTKGYIDLFNFDRCEGLLNNLVEIGDTAIPSYYGCSFSPNGKRLYVSSCWDTLFQFDLTQNDVKKSKQVVWINTDYNGPSTPGYVIAQHQLGPDGKIYIALAYMVCPNIIHSFQNQNLSVINTPDSVGLACNFIPFSFSLGNHRNEAGLPNMPNYNLGRLIGSPCDTLSRLEEITINKNQITIYPNPGNNEVSIAFSNETEENTVFELYDMIGNKVFDKKIEANKKQENFSVSQLRQGIYLYKLRVNNKLLVTDKLIIIR